MSSWNIVCPVSYLILSVVEIALSNLSGKMDFQSFEHLLHDTLKEVGREIIRQVLEELDRQLSKTKQSGHGE